VSGTRLFPLFSSNILLSKLSDDFSKKKNMRPNGKNWSICMEKFENFCLQKWIFAVFAVFITVLAVIGCMTEQLPPAQTCPLGGASD
jgi:hypothetical protein